MYRQYATTIDLRELADEAQDLYDETMSSCPECEGEGTVQVKCTNCDDLGAMDPTGPENPDGGGFLCTECNGEAYVTEPCDECGGEGELRKLEHCDDPERLLELMELASDVANVRWDSTDNIGDWDSTIDDLKGYAENESVGVLASEFDLYAQELASDIYGIGGPNDEKNHWPYTCIDWAQAARELEADYSEFTWQGDTYYIRSY